MPDLQALADALNWQAHWCAELGSPLYARLLEAAARDALAGGPVAEVLAGHEADPPGSALALRLMGSVHRLVLEGRAPQLAGYYPSAGGSPRRPGAEAAFLDTVAANVAELSALVERPVQTNEVGRAAALVGGFLVVAGATRLPLRCLELGASAGLNLRWDRFRYEARGSAWGPSDSPVRLCDFTAGAAPPFGVSAKVVERAGCDRFPVDATTKEGRRTLMSYVWPDQVARLRLLEGAFVVAQQVPVSVERAEADDWLERALAATRPGAATVVFHSIVMQYLDEGARLRVEETLRAAGERATDEAPLAWLRMEPGADQAEVRLTLWPPGSERRVATSSYHGGAVRWLGF